MTWIRPRQADAIFRCSFIPERFDVACGCSNFILSGAVRAEVLAVQSEHAAAVPSSSGLSFGRAVPLILPGAGMDLGNSELGVLVVADRTGLAKEGRVDIGMGRIVQTVMASQTCGRRRLER